jgi:hypothetical protein
MLRNHHLLFLLVSPLSVAGFRPVRQVDLTTRLHVKERNDIVPSTRDNPFRDVDIDLDKARDYVNHFGKYPVKDIEKMRDDLHAHRIQSMVFSSPIHTAPEEVFEEKALEDELNLQLHLLQEEFPDPYLFPQTLETDAMAELPHMKDGTHSQKLQDEKNIALLEEMAEEGVLESLAICGIIGLLMMAPQFL